MLRPDFTIGKLHRRQVGKLPGQFGIAVIELGVCISADRRRAAYREALGIRQGLGRRAMNIRARRGFGTRAAM